MDIGKLMLLAKSPESLGIPDDVGGKLLYTLQITLIGVGMVFCVLIIIMIVLYLFKLFFHKKTVSSPKSNENKTAVVSETAVTHLKNSEEHDEFETAAVISAAISAYLDEQNLNVSKYRIKSFKRI